MYKEYSPCLLLSPYIDKYWELKGNPEYGMRINILPDGCTDFIFTLGEATQAVDSDLKMKPYRTYFIGPMNTYSELAAYTETIHMLGVRFLPCGLSRFIRLPLHEFTNQRINADEVSNFFDASFAERLCEENSLKERVKIIEELFIKSLYKHDLPADPQITFAIEQINRYQGKLPIQSLMDDICLCQRQFERRFKMNTGYTPKIYSRIMKFKNAIDLLRNNTCDSLLSTAVHAGYYDVPHLSREIKNLSGSTAYSFMNRPTSEEEATLTYVEA
ncbi:helix-turn-helix domain-containing protein [uncultured Bacteroides sp.]|uniref:AraC family transcriptional regulator n=1 Tax=uncultured Bacteroides sp. TaxID=162156 RepID=UPI0025CBEF4F|nr:helix-turn-helix domain-containing protein [uncultured Bacteroides sp.]